MDFDLETEWPELMKLLTPPQYFAIRRAIAAAWHEGWDPNLMDVELLVRYIRDEGELPLPAPIDGPETEYVFDTWDSYFQLGDLGLPVFINYYNETNPRLLQHKEFLAVCARSIELDLGLATIDPTFDAAHLQTIHYYLFGDVYPWAGRFRTVNMSKPGGVAFADCQNGEVERYLDDVHRIAVETPWYQLSGLQFVESPRSFSPTSIRPTHFGKAMAGRRRPLCVRWPPGHHTILTLCGSTPWCGTRLPLAVAQNHSNTTHTRKRWFRCLML